MGDLSISHSPGFLSIECHPDLCVLMNKNAVPPKAVAPARALSTWRVYIRVRY